MLIVAAAWERMSLGFQPVSQTMNLGSWLERHLWCVVSIPLARCRHLVFQESSCIIDSGRESNQIGFCVTRLPYSKTDAGSTGCWSQFLN